MIDADVRAVLSVEGSAALVTLGPNGPHLVATWNSYIEILDDRTIAFPAGGFRKTEANIAAGSRVQMIIGAKGVFPAGRGYRLAGTARFESGGAVHERLREQFSWCRAAVILQVDEVKKVLG